VTGSGEPHSRGRRSIDAEDCEHATPIPTASRIGPLVASSIVVPFDLGTRSVPSGVDAQVDNLFRRVEGVLAAAGCGWPDVLRMTFLVASPASRDAVDRAWLEHFPDPASRPARSTQTASLPDPMEVQCEFLAHTTR
jgi:2-iminobutanoate/2-iminopropanoate deaminase